MFGKFVYFWMGSIEKHKKESGAADVRPLVREKAFSTISEGVSFQEGDPLLEKY